MARELGEEIRRARVASGLSQMEVGRAAGMSHAKVGRIERAEYPSLQFIELAALLAVVGLELSARAYPKGSPLRDRAHRLLLGALHGLLHPALSWVEEVPLPNPGDLRSWDALIRGGSRRTGVEAEMRPRDGQELHRRLASKRRDGGVDETIRCSPTPGPTGRSSPRSAMPLPATSPSPAS